MKKKLVSIILVLSMITLTLVGCGAKEGLEGMSKDELITAYQTLSSSYMQLQNEKNEIEQLYKSLNTANDPAPAIGYVGDATGAITFNSRDAKIIFPSTFQYPGSQQIKADNNVKLADGVFVSPGSNWVIKLNGTTLELEHSNGISGIIKFGAVTNAYGIAQLKTDALEPWFSGVTSSQKIAYYDIFTSNSATAVGEEARLQILIDSEDAFLICGMAAVEGKTITYVFTYRSQEDIGKNESILNVINTIQIGSQILQVNQ